MQESIVFLVRVQCRRKESSRSLSHLMMSFLLSCVTMSCTYDGNLVFPGPNYTMFLTIVIAARVLASVCLYATRCHTRGQYEILRDTFWTFFPPPLPLKYCRRKVHSMRDIYVYYVLDLNATIAEVVTLNSVNRGSNRRIFVFK